MRTVLLIFVGFKIFLGILLAMSFHDVVIPLLLWYSAGLLALLLSYKDVADFYSNIYIQ